MASLVRRLLFLAIVIGGPLAAGFLVTPGSLGDERFDIPEAALAADRPQLPTVDTATINTSMS
jgi:hypothetical protein